MGFIQCVKDAGVYVLQKGKEVIYIWLYVDDMIVFAMSKEGVQWVKK